MVTEELFNASTIMLSEAVTEVGKIGKWLQALGLVVIFYFVFQIVFLIHNKKREKMILSVQNDLKRLEKKIDKLKR